MNKVNGEVNFWDKLLTDESMSREELNLYREYIFDCLEIMLYEQDEEVFAVQYGAIIDNLARYVYKKSASSFKYRFEKLNDDDAMICDHGNNIILINSDLLNLPTRDDGRKNKIDFYSELIKIYSSLEHEYTHVAQAKHRQATGMKNNGIGMAGELICKFANLHPEKRVYMMALRTVYIFLIKMKVVQIKLAIRKVWSLLLNLGNI